jgi:LPPG:FO 2-phospho-L-lactate transferase
MSRAWRQVVALSGGVGGARLLRGLAKVLPAEALTAIVNTGDDFLHWGLSISPDLDTVMYTLAGLAHEERGWGLAEESFAAMEMVRRYGGESWFQVSDRDLATHVLRTQALGRGERLTSVTAQMCRALGVLARVLPMTDTPCRTILETREHGPLSFQDWFVRHGAPSVRAVRFEPPAHPTPEVLAALADCELVVIGPSNPYVSVDPILALPGVREAMRVKPVVALSPLVGGRAVKGPLAAMIPDLDGEAPTALAIARHYRGMLAGLVVEIGDEDGLGLPVHATRTVMRGAADAARLAQEILDFAARIR